MYIVYFKGVATGKQYKTFRSAANAVHKLNAAYGASYYSATYKAE